VSDADASGASQTNLHGVWIRRNHRRVLRELLRRKVLRGAVRDLVVRQHAAARGAARQRQKQQQQRAQHGCRALASGLRKQTRHQPQEKHGLQAENKGNEQIYTQPVAAETVIVVTSASLSMRSVTVSMAPQG
jgi:hypothetical protein